MKKLILNILTFIIAITLAFFLYPLIIEAIEEIKEIFK